MTTANRNATDTQTRILDIAERLVQKRGYNAFSYADVAAELHITTASLHYHFAGKAELGRALLVRYSTRFFEALTSIEASRPQAPDRLRAYIELYANVLLDDRLCLCGMLAAEHETLPETMREAVLRFFDGNEVWLTKVLEEGRADASLQFEGSSQEEARLLICGLEGAMLVARPYGDVARFRSAAERLIAPLSPRHSLLA